MQVSAYGLVGLSVGAAGKATSLSGSFSPAGKVCVMLASFMGKHRGLPQASDPIIDFNFYYLKNVLQAHYDGKPTKLLISLIVEADREDNSDNSESLARLRPSRLSSVTGNEDRSTMHSSTLTTL